MPRPRKPRGCGPASTTREDRCRLDDDRCARVPERLQCGGRPFPPPLRRAPTGSGHAMRKRTPSSARERNLERHHGIDQLEHPVRSRRARRRQARRAVRLRTHELCCREPERERAARRRRGARARRRGRLAGAFRRRRERAVDQHGRADEQRCRHAAHGRARRVESRHALGARSGRARRGRARIRRDRARSARPAADRDSRQRQRADRARGRHGGRQGRRHDREPGKRARVHRRSGAAAPSSR
ncbi:hydroxyethylthiazole kinase [Burkholderia pseudomallei]|nr:hydroxyethylthiazole kinase [Burkholderia pseudomallei]